MSINSKQINQMWHSHTMKYHSFLKRKEILTHTTPWMNLDDILLSEISNTKGQILYDDTYMRSLE